MRRREFITVLAGAATLSITGAHAQQPERMRRIGVLLPAAEDDAEYRSRVAGFLQRLGELGWTDGRNVKIEDRWSAGNPEISRRHAAELLALAPDVILANGSQILGPLQQATRAVPIVFVAVVDPVGAGYVATLSRPGGNITGFTNFEYSLTAKWLELLKEIAPGVTRAAVLRDPAVASGSGQFGVIQAMASLLQVEVSPIDPREAPEIERAVTAFASKPNGCLIITPTVFSTTHHELIISLAARHRLPAIYPFGYFVHYGGLVSYGPDIMDQYRRAAGYVDRILKGEKPADLPVQAPVKYELVINLKTAKALGIDIPATVRARADEVIE
jgi:putative ABC transport system substrate-binding protein